MGELHDAIQPRRPPMSADPVKVWLEQRGSNEGSLLRLRLARPKANVLDAAMIHSLAAALDTHRGNHGRSPF